MQYEQSMTKQLADCAVTEEHGNTFPLGETWRQRTAVLVFVRHFG